MTPLKGSVHPRNNELPKRPAFRTKEINCRKYPTSAAMPSYGLTPYNRSLLPPRPHFGPHLRFSNRQRKFVTPPNVGRGCRKTLRQDRPYVLRPRPSPSWPTCPVHPCLPTFPIFAQHLLHVCRPGLRACLSPHICRNFYTRGPLYHPIYPPGL